MYKFQASNLKYILQWTPGTESPFDFLKQGQKVFVENECLYKNCYITDNRDLLFDIRFFDAVLFNGRAVILLNSTELPKLRYSKQKYVFAAMESSHNYPVCSRYFDNYFNWTWTYRLESDVRWGYITFYYKNGSTAGPKRDMVWPNEFDPVRAGLKERLETKAIAAAMFSSNCYTKSNRYLFVKSIKEELKKFGLELDVIGTCGRNICPRSRSEECNRNLENLYYFYLAFENSFAEDYVTEKILTAVNHLSVPVVYGGANYSR